MQMLIFFLLGLLATPSKLPEIFFTALFIALFLTFIARPAAVFAILAPFKCKKEQMQLVSFAGLRGAASIVFAIMATVDDAYTSMDLFHIVFCIVLLSILFQGTFLSSVAKKLKMSDENEDIRKTFSDYSEEVDLQFIQLLINENHPWCLKPVKELILPPDALIVMILRDKKRIIPNGETILYPKDTVILSARIFAEPDSLSLTELRIDSSSPWIGNRISDFSPYAGELVIMIIRGEETIVPNGDTIILNKDLLVIYSSDKYKPDFSS